MIKISNRKIAFLLLVTLAIVAFVRFTTGNDSDRDSGEMSLLEIVANLDTDTARYLPPVDKAIRLFEGRLNRNPNSGLNLAILGELYARQARETGDVAKYNRAEAALRKAIELLPEDPKAQASLASVNYSMHEFAEALKLAEQAYEADPRRKDALSITGDAHLALGNYDDAEEVYTAFIMDKAPTPPVLARMSHLKELTGDPEEAQLLMERAARGALKFGGSKENVAWYLSQLGGLHFRAGRIDESAEYYEASLRISEDYYIALSRLGRARAAQDRYDDAIELYKRAIAIVPEPRSLAALGDLYVRTGDSRKATLQYDTIEVIATLAAINRQVYNRELALFYADHDIELGKALELAKNEMAVRKDIYGYDTLAWTLYKNNRLDEAKQAIANAMSLGTEDANLYYHAGMIYHGLGLEEQARRHLEQALSINPHFSLLQADIAHNTLETIDQSLAIVPSATGRTGQ